MPRQDNLLKRTQRSRRAEDTYSKVGKSSKVVRVRTEYSLVHLVCVSPTDNCKVSEATILEQPVTRVSKEHWVLRLRKNPLAQALLESCDLITVSRHLV